MTHTNTHPPHTRLPADIWAKARADFEAGASIRIVAERHGLNIRTVVRHMHSENWVKPELSAAEIYSAEHRRFAHDAHAWDALIGIGLIATEDEQTLLLSPDSLSLCKYAFRRAAEAASIGGPTEALSWMRLAQATARLRDRVNVDVAPLSQADYRRAAHLAEEHKFELAAAVEQAPPDASNT